MTIRQNESPAWQSRARQGSAGQGNPDQFYYATNREVVARLQGVTLTKQVRRSIHMLRAPKGCSIVKGILTTACEDGAVAVEIHDTETGVTCWAMVESFIQNAIGIDRGVGWRLALPLKFWAVEPARARQLELFEV